MEVKDNLEKRDPLAKKSFHNGKVIKTKPPFYVDLYYIITFYNSVSSTYKHNHEYLTSVLLAFYDFPEKRTPSFMDATLELFPHKYIDEQLGHQLWSALDQDVRPIVSLKVTIPLESLITHEDTPVKTKEVKYKRGEVLYALSGKVLAGDVGDELPAIGATVEIIRRGGNVIYTTKTNSLGEFEFKQLEKEVLAIRIDVHGYKIKEEVIDLNDRETFSKPLTLIINDKQP